MPPDYLDTTLATAWTRLISNDIGALRLSPKALRQLFVPHRTLLIEITLRRERTDRVFQIKAV